VSEAEQALERAEALVERLKEAGRRLESTQDAEAATEVLSELAEIAREIETELAEARRRAEEDARDES
jgi:poly(A) polymerase Pap1